MKQKQANLEYDILDFDGCCGIKTVLDFDLEEDYKREPYKNNGYVYVTALKLKEDFKTTLKRERAGMLVATTALTKCNKRGKAEYGFDSELLIEKKLKASGWKRKTTCINPKTANKITLWTFT
jgi:hypothetical protein